MKKLPTLHILNGDASVAAFAAANLPGQVLVWREVLSEGPVLHSLPEQEFWQKRQEFIMKAYHEPAEKYKEKVLNELQKLEGIGAFFEVVLWFDSDLMCQANLLYLLQRMHRKKPALLSFYTPKPGKHISELPPAELQKFFNDRQQVDEEQLQQAVQIWQLYAGPNQLNLQLHLQQMAIPFPYLEDALQLYLRRFPSCTDGLSQPERMLLQIIQNGATSIQEVMQQFWQQDPGYGFGDAQLQHILARLQPDLVQAKEPLSLSFFGERVLEGFASFTPKQRWLGGLEVKGSCPYCFDNEKKSLRKNC
ncbi:DUF1835 domain-containing protein [Pontibacter anaerobius]|uniref:DUF1835 domain-containing protein n=1 Tax=Pontibacter anaerobius TaxID=2993940 RepID=A0ABT3RG29_9BACT|nr:DUF1835 domain-containing protein [Pontibacter anaerobius]MCX2740353.1 DUF1835 domain-containing protein [Pontibacter anaerobius]